MAAESKRLPAGFREAIRFRQKGASDEYDAALTGESGTTFQVRLRRSRVNQLDFSVILAVCPPGSNAVFRLRRYNGKSHEHTNRIERRRFLDFHIHQATERYQRLGQKEDGYAEPTDRYAELWGAWDCLLADCAFETDEGPQGRLFTEGSQ